MVIITSTHYNNIGEINAKSATYVPFLGMCPSRNFLSENAIKLAWQPWHVFLLFPWGKLTKIL